MAFKGARQNTQAAIVFGDAATLGDKRKVTAAAAKYRVPVIYGVGSFVENGGLIAYAPDGLDMARRTAEPVTLEAIIARHAGREGPLLPILHDVQAAFGHVSEDVVRAIALALNLSRAEVSGVVRFYHDFRRTPDPRPVIRLCRAEACQARGCEGLAAHAERRQHFRKKYQLVRGCWRFAIDAYGWLHGQGRSRTDGRNK